MAIESLPNGGVIVTGPEDTRLAGLLTLASAIALELTSGGLRFSSRISTLQACRNLGLVTGTSRPHKKKQLALTVAELRRLRPEYTPNSSVKAAMDAEGLK